MDRDDARFVADALACRIAGDREGLERLAASSLMRLSALATRIRALAAGWPPALLAAAELMDICRYAGKLVDRDEPHPTLQNFVDKMRALADEPPAPPRNRAERRARAANLPRAERRRILVARPMLVH
jgi:hypothetical protein